MFQANQKLLQRCREEFALREARLGSALLSEREVPSTLWAAGLAVRDQHLQQILHALHQWQSQQPARSGAVLDGFVSLEAFTAVVDRFLMDHAREVARPQMPQLRASCSVLASEAVSRGEGGDEQGGWVSAPEMKRLLMSHGTHPFDEEEVTASIKVFADHTDANRIYVEDVARLLALHNTSCTT